MTHYPIFLDLRDRLCIVVGDTEVESTVRHLLACGARIRVIAAGAHEILRQLAADGQIEHVTREYRPGDLAGAFLAIAAMADPVMSEAIRREANQEKVLLTIVHDAAHSAFIVPAVLRRGGLCIAVSTGGLSPALARRLRDRLAAEFGPEYGRFLKILGGLRPRVAAAIPTFERRKALWYRLVDSEILELLRRGEEEQARVRAEQIVAEAADVRSEL
jgi:siroheme synthase-like protein